MLLIKNNLKETINARLKKKKNLELFIPGRIVHFVKNKNKSFFLITIIFYIFIFIFLLL
jgi:hypothetical protein